MEDPLPIMVYVAGSIAESLDNQAWRIEWKKWLESLKVGLIVKDPLIERKSKDLGSNPTSEGIAYVVRNDRLLVESCHVLLIVTDMVTPTIGTWVEMGWAFDKGMFIILYVENDDYPKTKRVRSAFPRRMCDHIIYNDLRMLNRIFENMQFSERRLT
jgi:nucleoside 2-deoxyribosyltransferase